MKLLIVGASGVLGSRLYNDAIKKKWNVMGTYCSHECDGLFHLDLRDKKSMEKVLNFFRPDTIALAGGLTDVDVCEAKPRLAEEINIKGTLDLIKKTKECGAKFIYVSTDYVFNGEKGPYGEDDAVAPINTYGRTKLEAEMAVESNLRDYLVVRTSQLYGPDPRGKNFAVKIIRNMRNNKKVYTADDFYCTPTYAGTLSGVIIELVEKDRKGLFNAAGPDFINRYEYVNMIADVFGLDKSLIQKVELKDLRLKAARPRRAGLKIDRIKKETGITMSSCKSRLELFKKEYV